MILDWECTTCLARGRVVTSCSKWDRARRLAISHAAAQPFRKTERCTAPRITFTVRLGIAPDGTTK